MSIFPFQKKLLVLPYPADVVTLLLENNIKNSVTYQELVEERYKGGQGIFVGFVKDRQFQISKKVGYWQSFAPQVTGTVEKTSTGSLLLLNFALFSGTKVLFYLFSFISILGTTILFFNDDALSASMFGIFYILNYIVTVAAFNMHSRQMFDHIEKLFSELDNKE